MKLRILVPLLLTATVALAIEPIRVGGNVAQANRIAVVHPVYPPEAKASRIEGTVTLDILIDEDGRVVQATPTSGPEELRQASIDAVLQWVYKPTYLNGQEVKVQTTVTINYTLSA
jgi:periplasmic protein TonB